MRTRKAIIIPSCADIQGAVSGADVGAGKKTNPRAIQPNAATANAVSIGTEAVIAVRDVLGLDHDEARAHGEWAVRELVRAGRH